MFNFEDDKVKWIEWKIINALKDDYEWFQIELEPDTYCDLYVQLDVIIEQLRDYNIEVDMYYNETTDQHYIKARRFKIMNTTTVVESITKTIRTYLSKNEAARIELTCEQFKALKENEHLLKDDLSRLCSVELVHHEEMDKFFINARRFQLANELDNFNEEYFTSKMMVEIIVQLKFQGDYHRKLSHTEYHCLLSKIETHRQVFKEIGIIFDVRYDSIKDEYYVTAENFLR